MIVWLDQKLFGNGNGIKSPHCDDVYYWLNGEIYTWIGGCGAQFQSFQWFRPKVGEERCLNGRKYRAFSSIRKGPRVRVAWQFVGNANPIRAIYVTSRKNCTQFNRSENER